MSKKKLYGLMVGINDYPIDAHKLQGCVNDMLSVKDYLEHKLDSGFEINLKVLTDKEATRENIIDGFLKHLSQAGPNDVAFFHFSGHGSQSPAPEEFWATDPDKMLESIVCWDSRLPGGSDIMGKELSYLIYKASAKQPHFLVLMDCCHSGSGTRDTDSDTKSRMADPGNTERHFNQFIGFQEYTKLENGQIVPPSAPHVLLAAALDKETAKETLIDGARRGVFTTSILKVLGESGGNITYQDLMGRASQRVKNMVKEQSPQLEGIKGAPLRVPFLGGAIQAKPKYFFLSKDIKEGWVINGGAFDGLPRGKGNAKFKIYETTVSQADMEAGKNSIGTLESVMTFGDKTSVEPSIALDDSKQYKACISDLNIERIKVAFGKEMPSGIREKILEYYAQRKNTAYFELSDDDATAEFMIRFDKGSVYLTKKTDTRPLFKRSENVEEDKNAVAAFYIGLEHVAEYKTRDSLENSFTILNTEDIELKFFRYLPEMDANKNFTGKTIKTEISDANAPIELRYEYDKREDAWKEPKFGLEIINKSPNKSYWASILYFDACYAIDPGLLPKLNLAPQQKFELNLDGFPAIEAFIPDEMTAQGLSEVKDTLKLFVSDTEIDGNQYAMDALPMDDHSLMSQSGRPIRSSKNAMADKQGENWYTRTFSLHIIKPAAGGEVKPDGISLFGGSIKIGGHAGLKGKVMLNSAGEATRSAGGVSAVPTGMSANPEMGLFEFTEGQGNSPSLSVLELHSVENKDSVSAESPLEIEFDQILGEDEAVIPFGYDPETGLYYPIGGMGDSEDGKIRITIETLPDPTPTGTRSLGGSIKMFFQKTILSKIGLGYEYPVLAEAIVKGETAEAVYNHDLADIQKKVAAANSIVLFIHGIIGDTMEMVKSVERAKYTLPDGSEKKIGEHYDLVLAFDYENLNTPIEDTAKKLGERLAAIGLAKGHGKTLHIVAHSMGGLVSRWFIEREGGKDVVTHLIQLGTPNGGSEWSNLQEWAKIAATMVMGKVSIAAPYLAPLTYAMKFMTKMFHTLGQMNPKSDFIQKLASSEDPGIPYSIIVGNTQMVPRYQDPNMQSLIKKMIGAVKTAGHYMALDALLFKNANDIACTVDSIRSVDDARRISPKKVEVGCDHISYFSDPVGLNALAATVCEIHSPKI